MLKLCLLVDKKKILRKLFGGSDKKVVHQEQNLIV